MEPLRLRAAEKIAHHAADCAALHRVFLPFASDTLGGIGAEPFIQWLKGVYIANNLRLRAEGDDGSSGRLLLDDLLAEWLAVLARDNVTMIERLTIRDTS